MAHFVTAQAHRVALLNTAQFYGHSQPGCVIAGPTGANVMLSYPTKCLLALLLLGAFGAGCGSDDAADEGDDADRAGESGSSDDAGPGGDAAAMSDAGDPGGGSGEWTSTRGQCEIDSGFLGDDTCLVAPAEGEGIQIHIGPASYSEADVAPWLVEPGDETSQCYFFTTP